MAQKKTNKRHTAVPPVKTAASEAAAARKKGAEALNSATAAVAVETPAPRAAELKANTAPATAPAAAPAPATLSVAGAALVVEMRGSDADAARDAAASLGTRGEAAAVTPLIEVLNNHDGFYHGVVRAAAAASLSQLGDARAVEALILAIHDPMAETSAEAVRALAVLGDKRAIAPLIEVVRNADGFFLPIVRRAAVIALAQLGGEQAIAALRVAASNDAEDMLIRQDAQQAMTRFAAAK